MPAFEFVIVELVGHLVFVALFATGDLVLRLFTSHRPPRPWAARDTFSLRPLFTELSTFCVCVLGLITWCAVLVLVLVLVNFFGS